MAPTLEEMRLACDKPIDSHPLGKPIASNAPTSSPARSNDSEAYTQEELEAVEDEMEVTSYSARDGRPPSSKPKLSGSSTSAASPASPTSLHGSGPSSLMSGSFQLRCGGVAAELELSCSILT